MILDDILYNLKNKKNKQYDSYYYNGKYYKYFDLYKYVCNIYFFLIKQNIKRPIVIYGKKEIYMKSCFLACSFLGITYIPIDENIPKDRVMKIIKEVNPSIVIGNLEVLGLKNISKNEIYDIMEKEEFTEIDEIHMKPNDIYYMIFTSGSTGIPKGVKITYENLDSCINWLMKITKANNDVILNQANFSFDLSVADLYLSLVSNSCQYILETNTLDFKNIFKELKNSNITIAVMTPSFAELLLLDKSFNENLLPNLKYILFCGEKLLQNTVKKLYSKFSNLKIINMYGPTECTFAVTSYMVPKNLDLEIPIGVVKDDCDIKVVNEKLDVLDEGILGEFLIIGKSVSDGYVNLPNNKKFIKINNQNAFLSGDIGYIKNGLLYYECRKDNQIKYKGYRIELSDIENNLNDLKYIENAVVTVKKSLNGSVCKIFAFVKLNSNIKEADIKKDLIKRLPEYMCPIIKIVDKFPINKNGKCDKIKLMEEY